MPAMLVYILVSLKSLNVSSGKCQRTLARIENNFDSITSMAEQRHDVGLWDCHMRLIAGDQLCHLEFV